MVSRPSMVDYYKELGVHRYATSNDIRTAYKRLALIWHPDRNKSKDAEEKFKKIKQAHDVLIDEKQRREYDQKQQSQQKTSSQTTNMKYTQPNQYSFNLQTFEDLMAAPIDPLDILSDIQFFQESDFTTKMMNSSSYRNLYTQLFNSMNNGLNINHQTPIILDNDRLFPPTSKLSPTSKFPLTPKLPPTPKLRPKKHSSAFLPSVSSTTSSKYSSLKSIPVIHSTMPNDRFLNELIDLHEKQNNFRHSSFFSDLTHCTNCPKKVANDYVRLIHHEQPYRPNNKRYSNIPTKTVRV